MTAIFLNILSFFFLSLFVFGVAVMLLTWRQLKFVKPKWIIFGQVLAFLSLVVFSVLAHNPLGYLGSFILMSAGLCGGFFYGKTVKITQSAKGIMMNYTLPFIITWSALLIMTQFMTITSGRVPAIALGLAILNTGLNLGLNGFIVWQYQQLRSKSA